MMYKRIIHVVFVTALSLTSTMGVADGQETQPKSVGENWTKSVRSKNTRLDSANKNKTSDNALKTLKKLSGDIQKLKRGVVTLNKDLRLMEERLLFPSSTKYSVFVSMSTGQFFTLESVKLKLDGKLVVTHLYSEKQRNALARGGIQKLYVTNLNEGKHTATAFFTGIGPNGRSYKRAQTLDFVKGPGGEYLELSIRDDGNAQEPIFKMKQW